MQSMCWREQARAGADDADLQCWLDLLHACGHSRLCGVRPGLPRAYKTGECSSMPPTALLVCMHREREGHDFIWS